MILTIEVTQEDIDVAFNSGRRGTHCSCPIYRAIQRHPELRVYSVGRESLYHNVERRSIRLPEQASVFSAKAWDSDFQGDVDLWAELKPFVFEVQL